MYTHIYIYIYICLYIHIPICFATYNPVGLQFPAASVLLLGCSNFGSAYHLNTSPRIIIQMGLSSNGGSPQSWVSILSHGQMTRMTQGTPILLNLHAVWLRVLAPPKGWLKSYNGMFTTVFNWWISHPSTLWPSIHHIVVARNISYFSI